MDLYYYLSPDNQVYDGAPVRSNSALANYLNKTINDYEIPISTKGDSVRMQGRAPPLESMYIAMEGGESLQTTTQNNERSDFTDSFETNPDSQPDSGRYEVQKVTETNSRC